MQFLDEMAPLTALHITRHPMTDVDTYTLTPSQRWYSFYRPRKGGSRSLAVRLSRELNLGPLARSWVSEHTQTRSGWRLNQLS